METRRRKMNFTGTEKEKAMKHLGALCSIKALVLVMIVCGAAPVSAQNPHPIPAHKTVNGPTPNPYLASSLYAITHFDSSQSDSTPYGPPRGTFTVDPTTQPIVYGGPINIITLASTKHPLCKRSFSDDHENKKGGST